MRFSIVIPVYNVESYLPETLSSVLAQSCADYEVILVDDGSTDGSPVLCDSFRSSCKNNVKVIHQKNRGLLAARRTGIGASEGDYVVSLDGDDLLRGDALEKISSVIDSEQPDIVYYDFSRSRDFSPIESPLFSVRTRLAREEAWQLFSETNQMNSMCRKAVSRRCIGVDVDFGRFGRLNMGEDAVQSCIVLDRAESAVFLNESLYYYRPNASSISSNITIDYLRDMQKVQAELLEYASRWDSVCPKLCCYQKMVARCVEELCHFVLHYASARHYADSQVALRMVSRSVPIKDCNRRFLGRFGLHTRLLAMLLKKRMTGPVWALSNIGSMLHQK